MWDGSGANARGIGPHLKLICGTRSSFVLLSLPHGPSRLVTVLVGTLWSSIKEVKAPFLFHSEHGIALYTMQGNRDSSRGEGKDLYFISRSGGNLGCILEIRWGWPFKTRACSATSGLLSSCEGYLRILLKAWQGKRDASRHEARDPESLSSFYRDIGVPINFQEESGIVYF